MYEETYFECQRCYGYWDMYEFERIKFEKNKCSVCGKALLCSKCYNNGISKNHCRKCMQKIENKRFEKIQSKKYKVKYDRTISVDNVDYTSLHNFYKII